MQISEPLRIRTPLLSGNLRGVNERPFTLQFMKRTEEQLIRWFELSAFTPVFRSHEGNRPEEVVQPWSNEYVIGFLRRFSNIYEIFSKYREGLMI